MGKLSEIRVLVDLIDYFTRLREAADVWMKTVREDEFEIPIPEFNTIQYISSQITNHNYSAYRKIHKTDGWAGVLTLVKLINNLNKPGFKFKYNEETSDNITLCWTAINYELLELKDELKKLVEYL